MFIVSMGFGKCKQCHVVPDRYLTTRVGGRRLYSFVKGKNVIVSTIIHHCIRNKYIVVDAICHNVYVTRKEYHV